MLCYKHSAMSDMSAPSEEFLNGKCVGAHRKVSGMCLWLRLGGCLDPRHQEKIVIF